MKMKQKKIHYEIPANIGIFKDTSSAVYSYKYKNDLYISYDKRNNPINYFKNTNSQYLCKKVYKGENFTLNINALYNLDSYQEYYKYFKNLFKNILGLHSEINYQCEEYYKSGSMLTNLKLPITFNKYVTFNTNFMLYYKKDQLLDDLEPSLLGKHVVINNNVLDNQMLNTGNSNRRNSIIYKRFMKDIIYTHKIGRKGFEYDDAKKICERIYTIYKKDCSEPTYKIQGEDYNIDYYKKNKKRDECFNIVYNDDKNLNNEQFIAKIKGFDPNNTSNDNTNIERIETELRENKWSDDPDKIKEYRDEIKNLKKIGNIDVRPQRLAHLNEVKTAAYYTADWDNIAWINDENPQLHNKSNLIKVQDKKVLWFDKDDENAINKGVVCYGRKLDQNKLAQNQKNEIYNFQMEKIEQSMNDIQNYENVSKFNKQVYSRWNL